MFSRVSSRISWKKKRPRRTDSFVRGGGGMGRVSTLQRIYIHLHASVKLPSTRSRESMPEGCQTLYLRVLLGYVARSREIGRPAVLHGGK